MGLGRRECSGAVFARTPPTAIKIKLSDKHRP